MKNNFFVTTSITGFVVAIFLSSFFKIGITFALFLIFISVILFLYRKIIADGFKIKQTILSILIFILFFAFGIIRYEIKNANNLDVNLENNIDNAIYITGVISDEPKLKEKQILIVDFKEINISSSTIKVSGKGIVSTDLYPEFSYGDLIKMSGSLEKPENFSNSSKDTKIKNDFDYISYLAKDDIFYKIDFAKTELISGGYGNSIKNFLFQIKNSFIQNISKTISEPESSLLSGILLGAKSSMDENTTETFRKSGLSHIVALSGYNITIVADAIIKAFSFLPKMAGFSMGIIGIILFVLMSGASSTAVRAGVMALIVIIASITHRNYQAGRALVFAGLIMIMVNPKILVFDISFQLSFLATIAIIYVAPILQNKFTFITEKFELRNIVSSTIAAQILVLPLILYKMGLLSLVALPANILVLVFIPTTMLFGFISGMIGFIWLPISVPFAWITFILLAYIIKVAEFFAILPFSSVNISWFSESIMILCYILIAIWIYSENKLLTEEKSKFFPSQE